MLNDNERKQNVWNSSIEGKLIVHNRIAVISETACVIILL